MKDVSYIVTSGGFTLYSVIHSTAGFDWAENPVLEWHVYIHKAYVVVRVCIVNDIAKQHEVSWSTAKPGRKRLEMADHASNN